MKRFLIAILLCGAGSAHAQIPPPGHPIRTIAVSGEAKMDVSPDQAVLNISLVSRDSELMQAKRTNDKLTKRVTNIALDMNIPKKNIATSHLHVSPEYNYRNNQRTLKGYVVNRSLRITMDTLDTHERLLSEVIAAGVDQVSGVQFNIANPKAMKQKLRAQAVKNAQAKANMLAEAAGMQLGKPISIASGAVPVVPQPRMMRAERAMAADSGGGGTSVAPTLPGVITLRQSVSITYEME